MKTDVKSEFNISISDLSYFLNQKAETLQGLVKRLQPKWSSKSSVSPELSREILKKFGYRFSPQVISFQMLKGGVAKTTSALNVGWRAAQYGARVLFIDLDQQANLTFALGCESENLPVWVDLVEKKKKIQEVVVKLGSNVDLIPSNLNNSVLDRVLLSSNRNWAQAVKGPLAEIRNQYDLIILDTAPNLSAINTAVTCASDLVALPINPDKFSWLGMEKNLQDLEQLKKEFDLDFQTKILFTRFDSRETSSALFLEKTLEQYSGQMFDHFIRNSTDIKNSIGSTRSLFSNKSAAKEDYDGLTLEILGFLEAEKKNIKKVKNANNERLQKNVQAQARKNEKQKSGGKDRQAKI